MNMGLDQLMALMSLVFFSMLQMEGREMLRHTEKIHQQKKQKNNLFDLGIVCVRK